MVKVNCGGDCKFDVSGCVKVDGCNDIYKYGVVGVFLSWSVVFFFILYDGVVDLFWFCCIGVFYIFEFFDW